MKDILETVTKNWRLCSHIFWTSYILPQWHKHAVLLQKWANESRDTKSYYTYRHIISLNIQALMILILLLWVIPHWAVLLASQLVRLSEWWGQNVRLTVVAVPATIFLQLIMEPHRHNYMQHYYITRMHISRSHLITVDAKRVTWNKFHTEDQQILGAPVLKLVIMVNEICASLSY
jgi:hypothetical protein